MKKILYTFFFLGSLLVFMNTASAQPGCPDCAYKLTATDTFGDGWDGGQIVQISTTSEVIDYTLAAGFGPECINIPVFGGETVTVQETTPGNIFNAEVGYMIEGPTGDVPVNVQGTYTGANMFTFDAVCPPPAGANACAVDLCADLIDSFGDTWNGGSIDITTTVASANMDPGTMLNGAPVTTAPMVTGNFANTTNAPIATITDKVTYANLLIAPGDEVTVDVEYVFNAGGFVGEVGYTFTDPVATNGVTIVSTNLDANMSVAPGGVAAGMTGSGTVVISCPGEIMPTPAPDITCGIYEVGKSDLVQAASAISNCGGTVQWYPTICEVDEPFFTGEVLDFATIEAAIAAGTLDMSTLCHEQVIEFFVSQTCDGVESDRFAVQFFVFNTCTDGCAHYLELTDTGNNGWGGASLTVSQDEGAAQSFTLNSDQGSCTVIQFCVADGGSLDLQYLEGGDDEEHGFNVLSSTGEVLLAQGPGPSTDVNTVKAACNSDDCAGETIDATVRITTGGFPDFMSWEIYDGFNNVNCQGPQVTGVTANTYAGLAPGTVITQPVTLEACNEYTVALFDGFNIGWNGATWELITTDIDYGTEITNPNDPFFGQSLVKFMDENDFGPAGDLSALLPGDEARMAFTFPCKPDCEDATSVVTLGDCFAMSTVLPIAAPKVCVECNHNIGCDIQVRHTILNDANDGQIAFQGAFTPIMGQTEIDYTALNGFQMSAGCHSYVTEYLYCDGLVTKCTSNYTVAPLATSTFTCNDEVVLGLTPPDNNPLGGFANAFNDDLGECVQLVTADLVIEGGVGSPVNINCEFFNINDFYEVIILDENDQPLVVFSDRGFPLDSGGNEILPGSNTQPANNLVSYNEIKQTLKYVINSKIDGTTCWGLITVEDKNAPTIVATDYDVNCNDPNAMDPFFSETITLESSAANELPANIAGGAQFNGTDGFSNTWIPFTVPCGRLGTTISDIQISLGLTHNDVTDLSVELHIPTAFNNSLANPFPGAIVPLDQMGDVGAANTYTPNPNNDSPALLGLLGASCKEFSSEKEINFISESSGSNLPQGHGKTWYLRVVDANVTYPIPPFGGGEITSVSMSLTCGYPFPYLAFDCALDNVELISETVNTNCDLLSDWNGAQISRVWRATDACGNAANATQTVSLKAPRIADLILPATEVRIECGDEQLDAEGAIDPAQTGGPAFCCDPISDSDFCKLSLTFTDKVFENCGNSSTIVRTWHIFNTCSNISDELVQTIIIEDTTGPTVNAGAAITVSANADCSGSVDLSTLDIIEDCGEVTAVRFEYFVGSVYAGGSTNIVDLLAGDAVDGLPMGATTGTVFATDECGNTSETEVTINVADTTAPDAVCDDLNISLNSEGVARVHASSLDEGSSDNCSDVTVLVGRTDAGPFAEFVDLTCADLGEGTLSLLVTDAAGNESLCWADILVEDVNGPTIICKDDATVTCDEALHLGDIFEEPAVEDNCGASITPGEIVTVDLPNCGQLLSITYTATDGSDKSDDASCTQTITVEHVSDFIVQFPADQEFDGCELGDIPGPIVSEDECENIGISVVDRVFTQVEDACYKIERTYTIINHCIVENPSAGGFTDLGTPLPIPRTFRDDDGYFQYTQIIKVNDEIAPSVAFTAPDPCDFTDGCEGMLTLTATGEDDCADLADLTFSWKIDANSDGTFDLEGTGADASGTYPYGDHIIKWTVTDGCGNATSEEYDFSVQDCKNPTPIADGLATVVMNDGGCVEITAAHLLKKAEDNCTERTDEEWQDNARVRIEGDNGALATAIEVCCADVVDGGVNVEVWVEDEAGNADFVLVFVEVQDNLGSCDDQGTGSSLLAGRTATETGTNVQDVAVSIDGDVVMTDANGIYSSFEPTGQMHNVTPEKLDNFAKDLSTFDIVLMAQHILQTNPLTTPYQHIAADVQGDADIDIFDMVELREIILFVNQTGFSNNTSWRFVDAAYTFQNPTTPWAESYPQYIDAMLTQNLTNEDFVAIKIGDLDGSATTNPFNSVEERNFPTTLTMNIDDVEMTAGNDYKVDFRASDFNDILGYQFTMDFDQNAADFISVEAGALNVDESNFGFAMLDEGIITTSFAQLGKAISVNNDEVLFSINFTAKADATLHNVLSLTNQYTLAEAYNNESEVSDVKLAFNNAGLITTTGGQFELFQNKPNPFAETSTIGFNLPEATTATVRIFDVSGKNLKVIVLNAARGYNEVNVNRNELGAAGVLYYQLDTDTDSAVKKMIILE